MRWVCLIAVLVALVSCERKPSSVRAQGSSPSPAISTPSPSRIESTATPSPQQSPTPINPFAEVAQRIRAAVVVVSVFDETGHLSANGNGFFVSDDGKFIADRSVMAGGVNAVAKVANGAIYNVSGALAQTPQQNLVLLKADAGPVLPFLAPSASALPEIGGEVAVVLSPVQQAGPGLLEEKITARFSDESGDWLDATPALPRTSSGAPVINQRGEVIGVVTFRAGNSSCVIRPASVVGTLLAQVSPGISPSWQLLTTSRPSASSIATRTPTPGKIPLRGSKLIYAPSPRYPSDLKRGATGGSGSFRVLFDANGRATAVQTVHSTGSPALDQAALSALHEWRSESGREWNLIVPITFK